MEPGSEQSMHLLACDLLLVNSGMSRQCHTSIVKVEQHWSILSSNTLKS